jgi:hypothetical protein
MQNLSQPHECDVVTQSRILASAIAACFPSLKDGLALRSYGRTERIKQQRLAMAEFIVITWAVAQGCMKQHEKVKKLVNYWRKNANRFKLKSLRYYAQAIGDDPFTCGRVMVYDYDSLADWESFEKEMANDKKAAALKEQLCKY